jgi:phosphate transport system substrate-binding protein
MKRENFFIWIFIFIFFSGMLGITRTGYAETVKIGGTGFALGVMKILAASFEKQYPEVKIQVFPSLGSSGGIKAVLEGALDIGLSARTLNEAETSRGAIAREISRTPFVFFANSSFNKDGLTFQDLERIYGGQSLFWPDGTRIRLILRPKREIDMNTIRKFSPTMDKAVALSLGREGMKCAITDKENASAIEKAVGGVGAGTLTQILSENRQVKVLSLNGVKPSVEGLVDGSYPWFKSLYLVTTARTSPAVQKFEAFIVSEIGGTILHSYGNMILTSHKR